MLPRIPLPKPVSIALLCILTAIAPQNATAQPSFTDVSDASGLGAYEMLSNGFGSGVAAADFDNDGDVDLFLPTADGLANRLYRNLGNGQFEEVAAALGLDDTVHARVALWIDIDGDHRLDLLVGTDCYNFKKGCDAASFTRLFQQTALGTFTEVTDAAGLSNPGRPPEEHRGGLAAADVNADGFVDFIQSYWLGTFDLFLNQGDGTFQNVSATAGIDNVAWAYHQPVMVDLNGDGLVDIYAAVDFEANRFWLNQGIVGGQPSFLDVAGTTGGDNEMNDMGVALGDYDGDGDPDLYITNIFHMSLHNILLRNNGATAVAFSETAVATGVDEGGWGWGTTFLDFDNNGTLDLAETNGWRFDGWDEPPRLFENLGGPHPTFVDRAPAAGLTSIHWGSAILAVDTDRDGDLDLIQTTQNAEDNSYDGRLVLHRNDLDRGVGKTSGVGLRYLVVRPRMTGANHWAIGARVTVEAGDLTMHRWITAGGSYLGQEPAEAFFGLAGNVTADRVVVTWPASDVTAAGAQTVLFNVDSEQALTVLSDEVFSDGFESGDTGVWTIP